MSVAVAATDAAGAGEPSPPRRRASLSALTGIRFVAAAAVLLFHFGASFAEGAGVPLPVANLLKNGYLGVSLFFMLSGFIITYTYTGRMTGPAALANYLSARLSRIYPVYVLALAAVLPFVWRTLDKVQVLRVLTMTQAWTLPDSNLGVAWLVQAWTLSIELAFYLLAPLLLWLLSRLPSAAIVALSLAGAAALPLLWIPTITPGTVAAPAPWVFLVPLPLMRFVEFTYGAALATLFIRAPSRIGRLAGTAGTTVSALAIVTLLAMSRAGPAAGLAMSVAGFLLLQLAADGGALGRLLSGRLMLLLGGASYAMYLLQLPVHEALLLLGSIGRIANPLVVVLVSIAVFRWYEEPARRVTRRLLTVGRHLPAGG